MCNRYEPPAASEISRRWKPRQSAENFPPRPLFPRAQGPFIMAARDTTTIELEIGIGQRALIPWFAIAAKLPCCTNNARFETVATAASFKAPWARSQRCIIPATWFDEPCWESGRNQWCRFWREDGDPWGQAGLWSTWTDKETGEVIDSYTMLVGDNYLGRRARPTMVRRRADVGYRREPSSQVQGWSLHQSDAVPPVAQPPCSGESCPL